MYSRCALNEGVSGIGMSLKATDDFCWDGEKEFVVFIDVNDLLLSGVITMVSPGNSSNSNVPLQSQKICNRPFREDFFPC